MKILAKYKTKLGGWAYVWCPHCREKMVFRSWRAAQYHLKKLGVEVWKLKRIDLKQRG